MIKWTEHARDDLVSIIEWIDVDDPSSAQHVADAILEATERLVPYPLSGRIGRVIGTRELVVPRLPYVIVYAAEGANVAVLRVLHGAMQWPPHR